MSEDLKRKKNLITPLEDSKTLSKKSSVNFSDYETDDDEGEQGSGAVGGEIHFRFQDAASIPPRDDTLPPNELKRLLQVHADIHKNYTDKQKQLRKERAALKQGKKEIARLNQQIMGQGIGGSNRYKQHPIANKAQFSGIDKQMTNLPNEFAAETNQDMRNQLENRFQHRLQPKFNPKPRPAGS